MRVVDLWLAFYALILWQGKAFTVAAVDAPSEAAGMDNRFWSASRGCAAVLALLLAFVSGVGPAWSEVVVLQGSTTFTTTVAGPHAKQVEAAETAIWLMEVAPKIGNKIASASAFPNEIWERGNPFRKFR